MASTESLTTSRVKEIRRGDLSLIEVTPHNLPLLDFGDLSWRPYFSGQYDYGEIRPEGLLSDETLRVLIPPEIVQTRVTAAAKVIATMIASSPQEEYVFGAIKNGGLWLDRNLVPQVEHCLDGARTSVRIANGVHCDIKSRWTIQTGTQVRDLPSPSEINGRTWVISEGVVDSGNTLRALTEALADETLGYHEVKPFLVALVDKIDARPFSPPTLPGLTLFYMGDQWMCGCGPDANLGRLRTFGMTTPDCIAVYTKS